MAGLRDIGDQGVTIAAGGYAILMQLANPAVAAGVARHSDFVNRPTDRLWSTLAYIYVTLYGTDEQRRAIIRSVNRAHGPVHSEEPGGYSAFDPNLQLWVAATLCTAGVRMHELVYGPLPADDADRVFRDYGELGTALQMPEALWPGGRDSFEAWWAAQLPLLSVGDEARAVARQIFQPTRAPLWLRAALPAARLISVGLLTEELRTAYGFDWSARHQRRFEAALRRTRRLWPILPAGLRTLPMRRLLARAPG